MRKDPGGTVRQGFHALSLEMTGGIVIPSSTPTPTPKKHPAFAIGDVDYRGHFSCATPVWGGGGRMRESIYSRSRTENLGKAGGETALLWMSLRGCRAGRLGAR